MEPIVEEVTVVGGGLIGLAIAWRLAERSVPVALIEAGALGAEASWAGAGMLTAGGELKRDDPWYALGVEGLDAYPAFVRQLEQETSLPIDCRVCGSLELAAEAGEWAKLERRAAFQTSRGMPVEALDGPAIRSLVPGVHPRFERALWYPGDALVNPRDVVAALVPACRARGVRIVERTAVREIRLGEGFVEAAAGTTVIRSSLAVLAAGAWSSSIPVYRGAERIRLPRVTPVKGLLVSWEGEPGALRPMLRHGHTYLLERRGGVIVGGSTEQRIGFDREVDPALASGLAGRCAGLLPALGSRQPSACWAGLRPAVRLGAFPVGQWIGDRLCLAYGHYRNGILMAPSTAWRIAGQVAEGVGLLPDSTSPAPPGLARRDSPGSDG